MFASENITRRIKFLNPLVRLTWTSFILCLVPCAFLESSIQSSFPIKLGKYWTIREKEGKLVWL